MQLQYVFCKKYASKIAAVFFPKNYIGIQICRYIVAFLLIFGGFSQVVMPAAMAQKLPLFFDNQERLDRPDVSSITRLRFLTTLDFPPFNYIDKTGRLSGYNIDLLRAICIELSLEKVCQVEALPWDELVAHLDSQGGEAIITGMNETKENSQTMLFTQSYLRLPARFIASHKVDLSEPVMDKLRRLKIGLVQNTMHEKIFTNYFPSIRYQPYQDEESLKQALQNKNIDLAFGDGMSFSIWLSENIANPCCEFVGGPYIAPQILPSGLRISVAKSNPQLSYALHYALKSLERKGKLSELYLRYFPIGFY